MKSKRIWVILIGAVAIAASVSFLVSTGAIAIAGDIIDNNLMIFLPLVFDQPDSQSSPTSSLVSFTPSWELGASTADPIVGSEGILQGWYTKETYSNGTKVNLELFIHVRNGQPGIGTGGYEIYLPAEIEPSTDRFVGHANVWIAGGGISEFDGSVKWTMRNTLKGPKLIFTFDGREWSPTHPKTFADLKLRALISYWL